MRPPLRLLRDSRNSGVAPLVFVHPVTGDASVYTSLAEHLAWAGAVIAVDAVAPPSSLAGLAADHIAALHEQVPGPWCLGGWAVGGVVAAEMSAQLADGGERCVAVAIMDARAPQPQMRQRPTDELTLAGNFVDVIARNAGRDVMRRPARADADELLSVLHECGAAPHEWDAASVAHRFAVFTGIVRAFFQHEQRQVPVPVALFETQESHPQHPKPPTLGWEPYAPTLVRVPVPGTHFTLMSPQHVERLARIMDDTLIRIVTS